MIRALLILLFLAAPAWGQTIVPCRDILGNEHRFISGRGPIQDNYVPAPVAAELPDPAKTPPLTEHDIIGDRGLPPPVFATIDRPSTVTVSRERPDPAKTPGIIAEDGHDWNNVCGLVHGLSYSKRHRQTPTGLKAMIRKRDHCDPQNSEVDHRIPLSIGGADVVYNLFCEPGPAPGVVWSYEDKDRLERLAWERVCRRRDLPLSWAQAWFQAPDWTVLYCQSFADERCPK